MYNLQSQDGDGKETDNGDHLHTGSVGDLGGVGADSSASGSGGSVGGRSLAGSGGTLAVP